MDSGMQRSLVPPCLTVIAGTALVALVLAATADARDRIVWETWTPEVATRPDPQAPSGGTGRVAPLDGRLLTFEPADADLYAVFLDSEASLTALRQVLTLAGAPPVWRRTESPQLEAFLEGPGAYEWLQLGSNGSFRLVADDLRQPGKTYVVVVNADGDILGSRPLWTAPEGLAAEPALLERESTPLRN